MKRTAQPPGELLDSHQSPGHHVARGDWSLGRVGKGAAGCFMVSRDPSPRAGHTPRPAPLHSSAGDPITNRAMGDHKQKLLLKAAGLCAMCGKKPLQTKWRCADCAKKARIAARKRLGYKPWKKGGRGRPPIGAAGS